MMTKNKSLWIGLILILLGTTHLAAQNYYRIALVKKDFVAFKLPPETVIEIGTTCDIIRLNGQQAKLFARAKVVKTTPKHVLAKISKTLNGYTVAVGDYLRLTPMTDPNTPAKGNRSDFPQARIGAAAGVNFDATTGYGMLDNSTAYQQIKPAITPGFQAGIVFEYCNLSPFIVNSGLYFFQSKSSWELETVDDWGIPMDITRKLTHLSVPLSLKLKLGPFYAFGGINFNYFLKATAETGLGLGLDADWSDEIRKSLLAYDAGIGLEFKIQPNGWLFIEERYTYSNQNLIEGMDPLFESLSFGGHRIMVGYLFGM